MVLDTLEATLLPTDMLPMDARRGLLKLTAKPTTMVATLPMATVLAMVLAMVLATLEAMLLPTDMLPMDARRGLLRETAKPTMVLLRIVATLPMATVLAMVLAMGLDT